MKLTVVEYAGEPVAHGVSALFSPPGGIIGRSNGCSLVLNDAERRISRVQAVLSHDGAGWRLRNASTVVPVVVGAQQLELDEECALQSGQLLRIGPYLLRSEDDEGMLHQNETAGEASLGNAPFAKAAPAAPQPAAEASPFAELLDGFAPLAGHDEAAPDTMPALALADDRPWTPPSQFGVLPEDDAPLFGAQLAVQPPPADSNAGGMALGGSLDPLALFDMPAQPVDLLANLGPSLLNLAPGNHAPLVPAAEAPSAHVRVNVADQVDIGRTALKIAPVPAPREETIVPAVDVAPPPPRAAAAPCSAHDAADACAHFMAAAGIGHVQPDDMPLDQRMAQLGALLGLFVDGTVRLLSSRALLKREVRAEITQVLDTANNPFKILPSGQAVLMQMFGPHMPGFLSAEDAVRDALQDLQHHQLGMLAGMRAALFELIEDVNPQRIESEHAPRNLLDRLFPGRMQARCWQQHRARHQTLLKYLDDEDFYRLFGQTFQRAYEEEIRRCAAAAERREGRPA